MSNKGAGLLNKTINALPIELHIPGYQFCGPGTRLQQRLANGDTGINPLDVACREHDIAYSSHKDLEKRHVADSVLAEKARQRITAKDSSLGEKVSATAVWAAMKAKTKLGMGVKKNARKKTVRSSEAKKRKKTRRIMPIAKRGGFIPFLLPALSALGALSGGAAGIAKAVNDAKAAKKQLEEAQRHNKAMEGRGLYLSPYKRGKGMKKKKNVIKR